MKNIAILGSTGSIGTQTLDIVREQGDLRVWALTAGKNIELLEKQIREFRPKFAAVWEEDDAKRLRLMVSDLPVQIASGMEGLIEAAVIPESEILVTAVVGMIGLHLQFHLHHVNWIGEIQELVVMPQARGLNVGSKLLAWAEEEARQAGAEMTELSTNVKRHDAHRFYLREGYEQSHFRFTKAL